MGIGSGWDSGGGGRWEFAGIDYNAQPHPIGAQAVAIGTGREEGFSMRSLCGVLVLGLAVSAGYSLQAQGALTPATYPAKMKEAAQANGAALKALKGGAAADAVAPAKTAAAAFADIENFWKAQKKDDAVKLAAMARMGFSDAAAAAEKGDAAAALTAATNAAGTCKQCHGLYREGDPQSGFKFKAGAVN